MTDELAHLLDTAAHHSSPALAGRIADIEAAMQRIRGEQAEHVARHALLTPTRRQAHLDEIDRAAHTQPLDRAALNAALRVLLSAVVVNFRTGDLEFRWKFGDETHMFWAWPEDDGTAIVGSPSAPFGSANTDEL
jgi:hypothetical protein